MAYQVRDIGIIGLLLKDQIVFRDRVWRLLRRVLRDLGLGFGFLLIGDGQRRFGVSDSLAAPSCLAGRCPDARRADGRSRYGHVRYPTRRAHNRLARQIVEACLARLTRALGAARGLILGGCVVDGGPAVLATDKANGAAGRAQTARASAVAEVARLSGFARPACRGPSCRLRERR
jgi:hypothetical protein